jgi:hypothetical protein
LGKKVWTRASQEPKDGRCGNPPKTASVTLAGGLLSGLEVAKDRCWSAFLAHLVRRRDAMSARTFIASRGYSRNKEARFDSVRPTSSTAIWQKRLDRERPRVQSRATVTKSSQNNLELVCGTSGADHRCHCSVQGAMTANSRMNRPLRCASPSRPRLLRDCFRAMHPDLHLDARAEPVDDRYEAVNGETSRGLHCGCARSRPPQCRFERAPRARSGVPGRAP